MLPNGQIFDPLDDIGQMAHGVFQALGRGIRNCGKSAESRHIVKKFAAKVSHIQRPRRAVYDHIHCICHIFRQPQGRGIVIGAAHRQIPQHRRICVAQQAIGGVVQGTVSPGADHQVVAGHTVVIQDLLGPHALDGGVDCHFVAGMAKFLQDHIDVFADGTPAGTGIVQEQCFFLHFWSS